MSNNRGKKIDALIRGIATRSVSFREAVQKCAVMIVEEAKETNNCTRALTLAAAIGMASDRVKYIQWLSMVSPINVTFAAEVAKRRVGLRKIDSKAYNPFNVELAKATPYYTVGKSDDELTEEMTSGDFNALIVKLAKRMRRKLSEGKVAANDREAVEKRAIALEQLTVAA